MAADLPSIHIPVVFCPTVALLKVFISSRIDELFREREAIEKTINGMQLAAVRFEILPASPVPAPEFSIHEVSKADIFVQIVGVEISDIVRKEYETANSRIPRAVLVFSKESKRTAEATTHLRVVAKDHKYRAFKTIPELRQLVKEAIQALIASEFRQATRGQAEEIIFEGSIQLGTDQYWVKEVAARKEDRIQGLVRCNDNFDGFVFTEEQYADWLNNKDAWEPDRREAKAWAVDFVAKKDQHVFVVVVMISWLAPRWVTINLRMRRATK